MTQQAVVTKLLPNHMAEVAVTRETACGGNCGNCESCLFQHELKTAANNLVEARPGQRVMIESRSSAIFGAAILVYIIPLLLFLLGYVLAYALRLAEPLRIVFSFCGLVLGGVFLVISQRREKKREISFDIVEIL